MKPSVENKALWVRAFGIHLLWSVLLGGIYLGICLVYMEDVSQLPLVIKWFFAFVAICVLPLLALPQFVVGHFGPHLGMGMVFALESWQLQLFLVPINSTLFALVIVLGQNAVALAKSRLVKSR